MTKDERARKGKRRQNEAELEEDEREVVAKKLTVREKKALHLCLKHQLQEAEGSLERCRHGIDALHTYQRSCSDLADKSQVEEDLARAVRQRDRLQAIIGDSRHALGRLEEGSYGTCENPDCEDHIGLARLQANPSAKLCLGCQQEHEVNEAKVTHPRYKQVIVTA